MTEKTKNALKEFIRVVLAALVSFLTAVFCESCGSTTRATISNRAENTVTEVKITTNNPSTIEVSPNTEMKLK